MFSFSTWLCIKFLINYEKSSYHSKEHPQKPMENTVLEKAVPLCPAFKVSFKSNNMTIEINNRNIGWISNIDFNFIVTKLRTRSR